MNIVLRNKVAVVTGGTSGLGEVISLNLLREGCKLFICCKSKKSAKIFSKKYVKYKSNFNIHSFDANKEKNISKFIKDTIKKYKKIDILINNIGGDNQSKIKSLKPGVYKNFLDCYNLNFGISLNFIIYALPKMKKNKWGRVINISSISTLNYNKRIWYLNAKNSIDNLTKYLSTKNEYCKNNITFNSISPGLLNSKKSYLGRLKNNNKKLFIRELAKRNSIEKICEPEYVSNLIVYLCSNSSEFINGSNIVIDGGENLIKH